MLKRWHIFEEGSRDLTNKCISYYTTLLKHIASLRVLEDGGKKVSVVYTRKSKGHISTHTLSSWPLSFTPWSHKISVRTSWKPNSTLPTGNEKEKPLSSHWCKPNAYMLSTVPFTSVSSAFLRCFQHMYFSVTSKRNLSWQRSNRGNSQVVYMNCRTL